jgi:hypothetical protein
MFFANVFSYAKRRQIAAAAFRKIRRNLLARAPTLAPQFACHGIRLDLDRLRDERREVAAALCDARPLHSGTGPGGVRQTTRDLGYALGQLDRWLGAR